MMLFSNVAWPMVAQGVLCVFMLASCQFYEPYSREQVFKGAYERNFVRTFGTIDPSTDWDFSDGIPPIRRDSSLTRTGGADYLADIVNADRYYEVNKQLFDAVISQIQTSTITDRSFAFLISENDCFDVFPVYLTSEITGQICWSLQMFVDNEEQIAHTYYSGDDFLGWRMGVDVKVKTSPNGSYQSFSSSSTCRDYGVRSRSIVHYENSVDKKLMHFALMIPSYNATIGKYAIVNSMQSSLHYQMRILDVPKPAGIGDNLETLFVACEAADVDAPSSLSSGKRYQSLVFMIVGPHIPKVLYVRNDSEGKGWVDYVDSGKRYMIEDLGSSSDFDFNDIVVDVENATSTPINLQQEKRYNTQAKATTVNFGQTQASETRATLRFLCGTRPFRLVVGGSSFGLVTDPTDQEQTQLQLKNLPLEREATYFRSPMQVEGWTPNTQLVIPDWDPSLNKVSIEVWPNGDVSGEHTEGGWKVQFPSAGEVPFMMALPTHTPWSAEGVRFTEWQKYVL